MTFFRRLGLLAAAPLLATAQSTNGLVAGRVTDAATGGAIGGASVVYRALAIGASGRSLTSADGRFALAALSPDTYQVRVSADGFQPQEVSGLELAVAARLEVDFRLRPLADVFSSREQAGITVPGSATLVRFFGPDVDMSRTQFLPALRTSQSLLEPSLSEVIHPREIRDLPLAGRDVYSLLVTQAGVTADSGTARGLGLAANGQRPSSANFLLDGVEHNNNLITGPLTAIAPEAVQEYRFTSSNFSAEFGGTSGFIANAATRAGGAKWHGTAYYYGKRAGLNAAGFQENRLGLQKAPSRENQPGFQVGGPLRRDRLFVSGALEIFRSRSEGEAREFLLPGPGLTEFTAANGPTRRLLQRYPSPVTGKPGTLVTPAQFRPPVSVNRLVMLQRGDWLLAGGAHRLISRLSISGLNRPDFIWTPYPDFVSPLRQRDVSLMGGSSNLLRPNLSSESRVAYARNAIEWARAHPEVPSLSSGDGVALPGSPAFYDYRNRSSSWELRNTMTWIRGAHIFKFGGSGLLRSMSVLQSTGRDGLYLFDTVIDWALDEPQTLAAPFNRAGAPAALRIPDANRHFQRRQFAGFLQDTWRLTPRIAVNAGVRYDSYGAPVNDGETKDLTLSLGAGTDFATRLATARFTAPPSFGNQTVHAADRNDWAGRFGISWSSGCGAVVRGSYGIFYDRLFDNAWQNIRANSIQLGLFSLPSGSRNYLEPLQTALTRLQGSRFAAGFPAPVLIQPGFRTGYSQSYFFGVEQRAGGSWAFEINTAGSLGRKLATTDIVNRQTRLTTAPRMISYLSNQGLSDYRALTAVARFRPAFGLLHVAYTLSHATDLQSEPLSGDFFDLSFTRAAGPARNAGIPAFSRELDPSGDRGNSNFDQRHNFVVYSVWDLPGKSRLLRNWKIAQMAAARSGFPLTVFGPSTLGSDGQFLLNARTDVLDETAAVASIPVAGGERWLNAAAFRIPAAGQQGNTKRNAFRGPGLVNLDLSLTRSFALPRLGESSRLSLRMDAFNFLNHANLNSPGTLLGSRDFGIALRGRTGRDGGFPALTPFTETARQLQFLLRVEF